MRKHVHILGLIFLATACECPINENYIEIKEPDKEISVSMDLNAFTNGEAILINKATQLEYSLNLSGKTASKIIFTLGSQIWETTSPNGSLLIDETSFPNGNYTLKAQFYAPTGSGSIADQLEAEAYSGEMSWPVIIDYQMALFDIVTYRTNENRSLELSWQAPILSHLTISSYTIQATNKYAGYYSETVPANQTYFIDTRHIGIETTYMVYANVKYEGKENLTWHIGETKVPENLPRLYTSEWDMEHIQLCWELPYNCLLSFTINREPTFSPAKEATSMKLPVINFGTNSWYDANQILMTLSRIDHPSENIFQKEIAVGSPGYFYENERSNSWCYNPVTKMLYANSDFLNAYQYPQLTPETTLSISRGSTVFTSYTEPLLAIATTDNLEIRDARTLNLKHTLTIPNLNSTKGDIIFTSDGKLIYKTTDPDWVHHNIVVSKLDGSIISSTRVGGNPILISPDGKRIGASDFSGMKIIELENDLFSREYILPIPIEKQGRTIFNPINPSQLIISDQENHCIEIRNCQTYELIENIRLKDEMQYLSTDPVTGNLLVGNDHKLSVLSAVDYQEIFTVNAPYHIWPTLTGDYLISYDGYILNIKNTSSK